MSVTPSVSTPAARAARAAHTAPPRRVRHQAKDALALMAFSAASSMAVAAGFLLLASLGR